LFNPHTTFPPTKCCAEDEWLQSRAALQHVDWVAKVGSGPFMSIDTKGGEPPFAAVCTKASYAQIVTFAKFQLFSDSGLSCRVRRKLAVSPTQNCSFFAACARSTKTRCAAAKLLLHRRGECGHSGNTQQI
jgi:hypothetical protein